MTACTTDGRVSRRRRVTLAIAAVVAIGAVCMTCTLQTRAARRHALPPSLIAFSRGEVVAGYGPDGVWLLDPRTSQARQLWAVAGGVGHRLAGDHAGREMAVTSEGRLAILSLTSGRAHFVGGLPAGLDWPSWSPAGDAVVVQTTDPSSRLFVVQLDADRRRGRARALTPGPEDKQPDWSQIRDVIAFSKEGDIWTVRPDGSEPTNVTGGGGEYVLRAPRWAPDGRRIGATGLVRGTMGLHLISYPGGDIRALTAGIISGHSWSPGGTHMVFSRKGALFSVDVATGEEVRLTAGRRRLDWAWECDEYPEWLATRQ